MLDSAPYTHLDWKLFIDGKPCIKEKKSPSFSQTRGMTMETQGRFWIFRFGLQWEAAHKLFEGPIILPFRSLCYSCLKFCVPRVISKETHSDSKKSDVSWNEESIFSNLDWKKLYTRMFLSTELRDNLGWFETSERCLFLRGNEQILLICAL